MAKNSLSSKILTPPLRRSIFEGKNDLELDNDER
jgi:hypothetical protein